MLSKVRSRLSYANVMASVAAFIALGGTSYAVATGSIDSREIKNNTVRSKDVRNQSLLAKDFAPGQLQAGPKGDQGAPGTPGTARAYAHVLADGTLDSAQSSGVQGVQHAGVVIVPPNPTPVQGTYCFKLDFTPQSAVASADSSGAAALVQTNIPPDFQSPQPECAAGFEAASATTYIQTGGAPPFGTENRGFYIVFN